MAQDMVAVARIAALVSPKVDYKGACLEYGGIDIVKLFAKICIHEVVDAQKPYMVLQHGEFDGAR